MEAERHISIAYTQYDSLDELPEDLLSVARKAVESASSAYAPYSALSVGAAVQMSGGAVVSGSNQENAAFPSGVCAEKVTMGAAFSTYPDQYPVSIAIAAMRDGALTASPVTPCGGCRDALSEAQKRSGHKLRIICVGRGSVYVVSGTENLLPLGFTLD